MRKIKLAVAITAVILCFLLHPGAAFAQIPEGEDTGTEIQTDPSDYDKEVQEKIETDEDTESNEGSTGSFDIDGLVQKLSSIDPEVLKVFLNHPDLISLFLPALHVTVGENSVTISENKNHTPDALDRTGTVTTPGTRLNVRTGAGTDHDIITQLNNGSSVKVCGEKDGWYEIEIPAGYGYVSGEFLDISDTDSASANHMPSGDDYSFDIDSAALAGILELFQGIMDLSETKPVHGLSPDGNLTLVDDLGERNGTGQQFVTLVTKNGNYFYLIIDRDEKGEETVHFLNMVDERDLFSLMEEDEADDYRKQQEEEQAIREAERASAEAEAASRNSESENVNPDKEPTKGKNNMAPDLIIVILLAAGGIWYFMQTKKKRQKSTPDPDAGYSEDDEEDYDTDTTKDSEEDDENPYEEEIPEDTEETEEE